MKVYGPYIPSGKYISYQTEEVPVLVGLQGEERRQDSLTLRLVELFWDKRLDIPKSQLRYLEAEFSAMGIQPDDLDSDMVLRAVLLHRHNIPIDPSLIKNNWEQEQAVFEKLAKFIEHAYTVLRDTSYPVEIRTSVEFLLKDIKALLIRDDTRATMRFSLDHIMDKWAYALEADLRRMVEGNVHTGSDKTFALYEEFRKNLEIMLHPLPEDTTEHPIGHFIEMLRDAISEFRMRIQHIPLGKTETPILIKETISALGERLSVLRGNLETFLASGGFHTISAGMIEGFFDERMRELEHRLSAGYNDETVEVLFPGFRESGGKAPGLREVLQKSGMAFEWQLLSWYRSGKDPARLHALMHEDLKGILINFINSMKEHNVRGSNVGRPGKLRHEAQSVIDSITKRQIANCLNHHTEKWGLYLEVPFGVKPGYEYAKIRARGFKKPGENTFDPENLSLMFNVEMSHLGKVNVLMSFSGKAVSLQFTLEDEVVRDLAEERREEIRDSLETKGFVVQTVVFGLKGEEADQDNETNSVNQMRGVDIVG